MSEAVASGGLDEKPDAGREAPFLHLGGTLLAGNFSGLFKDLFFLIRQLAPKSHAGVVGDHVVKIVGHVDVLNGFVKFFVIHIQDGIVDGGDHAGL